MKPSIKNLSAFLRVLILLMTGIESAAVTVKGMVRHDVNHDGWPAADEPGIAGMLVSDGFGFAVTDAEGRYQLELNPKAQTVYVQRNDRYTADVTRFWHRITPKCTQYDFLLEDARPVTGDTLTMLIIGDSETQGISSWESSNLYFVDELKRYIWKPPRRESVRERGRHQRGESAGHGDTARLRQCGDHGAARRLRLRKP